MRLWLLFFAVLAQVSAQDSCPSDCIVQGTSGDVFDLSALKGKTFTTTGDGGHTYTFTMCGQSPTVCPEDPDVMTGMAVQTLGTSQCFVLGVYDSDQTCTWQETEPGSASILALILENGSPTDCGGLDRSLAIKFNCPDDKSQLVPDSWTATNAEGTCDYEYEFDTCAVCPGGCTVTPKVTPKGSWGVAFLVTLAIVLPGYLVFGAVWNYKVNGLRGSEIMKIHPTFWGTLYTNVKAGFVFVFKCGDSQGSDKGAETGYAKTDDSGDVSYGTSGA